MTTQVEVTKADLLDRVSSLLPAFAGAAVVGDEKRAIPPESAQAMLDAGLARILLPRRHGGYELGLDTWFDVVRMISSVDASHGWCASLIIHHPHYIGQFANAAQEDVWALTPDVAICASIAPVLKVTATDGGYLISGRSSWTSGVGHSDWALLGGFLPESRIPDHAFFLVPATHYTVEQTWDTIGMRGTGSNTVITNEVFVPATHVVRLDDLREGNAPGALLDEATYYRAPWITYAPATFVTPILGAAQGALERFRAATASRATSAGASVAGYTSIQTRLARAAVDLDSAELLLRRALRVAESSDKADLALRSRNYRDFGRAAELATGAIDLLMGMSGSGGFSESQEIQRVWRDLHVASSHVSLNPEQSFSHWARLQFGLEREPRQQMY